MDPATANFEPADELVRTMRFLARVGLNTGSAGNASFRDGIDSYRITPSGIAPPGLTADAIVTLKLDGAAPSVAVRPSSEWRMHRDIYRSRPDVRAVVHTHSSYATALACRRESIPAFHYMVAVAGGNSIRCAPYATFGTRELSAHAIAALAGRKACLLANHGVLALGVSPMSAANLALEVEQLARQYCIALQGGEPVLLSDEEMRTVLEKFESYGQRTA